MKLKPYKPIEDSLAEPLPETADDVETVREMVAFAESYGVILSQHRRQLLQEFESLKAKAILRLRKGEEIDDEGNIKISEEARERYAKMNADEKKILFDAEVSDKSTELEYVTTLEDLVKRRCSFGQSLLNSFNIEIQSSWNK